MNKLDTQSHLKNLISKFGIIGSKPRALQLDPERYGRLLEEITSHSAKKEFVLNDGKTKENVQFIRRL